MIDAARIDELLTRAEGLQRQIEDLQALQDVVLEPVSSQYAELVKSGRLQGEALCRFHALPPQRLHVHPKTAPDTET